MIASMIVTLSLLGPPSLLGPSLDRPASAAAAILPVAPAATQEVAAQEASQPAKTGTIEGTITTKPSKYRKWVVVSIKEAKGKFKPPKKHVVMDQKDLKFIPHVLPVLVGTTVDFLNSDNVAHNVFSPEGDYDLGSWTKGKIKSYTFKKLGEYTQLCNVHPEMEAYVIVRSNPYFTVSDKEGKFSIKGVPPGEYTLVTWSQKRKPAEQTVTVKAGEVSKVAFELKRH